MKKPIIAGNWKMHNTISESISLSKEISESLKEVEDALIILIPPFTSLYEVEKIILNRNIKLGAQDVFCYEWGPFTGEISPLMIKDAGCEFSIVGHSERRTILKEDDDLVNKKIISCIRNNLIPIVCIGETLEEREKGLLYEKIECQIEDSLKNLTGEDIQKIIIAYEPIWAIGTGVNATPEQAEEMHLFIRKNLEKRYGNETSSCAIIIYGGSVKEDNIYPLIIQKDVDGVLVGGASLKSNSFCEIVRKAIEAQREKEGKTW
ncbi:MAG: triose-phosphate isomerase [Acidobacteriota bacterium]